jgi:hypothetical protein
MIGYLGDIQFDASKGNILTFKDLSHSSSAKFHNHEIIGKKPLSEFLGTDLDKLTLNIELNAFLGVSVSKIIKKIRQYEQTGEPLEFVVGSNPFGADKWVIESSSRAYNQIYVNGVCTAVTLDLNLVEYISDIDMQTNIKKITFFKSVENVDKSDLLKSYSSSGLTTTMNPLLNTIIC